MEHIEAIVKMVEALAVCPDNKDRKFIKTKINEIKSLIDPAKKLKDLEKENEQLKSRLSFLERNRP